MACLPAAALAEDEPLPPRPAKTAWQNAIGSKDAIRLKLKERLVGWPTVAVVDAAAQPKDGRKFLRKLAADTWSGMLAFTDKENGLPADNIHFGNANVDIAKAAIGDYTSPTNIGMRMIALTGALDLGFVDWASAERAAGDLLATLEKLERYQGFFYNYYDTTTLEPSDRFVSFVDSAWLTAGLMATRQAFPELSKRCSRLIDEGNYNFFYDNVLQHMRHGYYVNRDRYANFHYGMLYSEARFGSLIAIGKGDVPASHWFAMHRTLPEDHTWQAQIPVGRHLKKYKDQRTYGGRYRWKEYEYVPSWGGSVFEALMPRLVIDEAKYAPNSLGRNGLIHSTIHRRYAMEDLGYPVWGMSPSATPVSDEYHEYGAKMLGIAGYPDGVVTPHAAALALLTTPKEATANLQELARRYPVYGQYGFYDAVNPKTGQVAYQYLALDQGMLFIATANYLSGGAIHKRLSSDPILQKALPLIGRENFFN